MPLDPTESRPRRMRPRPDIYIPGVTAPTYVQKLAEQVPLTLALAGAVLALLATLFPFDFYAEPVNRFVWDITRHVWADKVYDFVTNVLLFVPLGIGVAARFMRGGFRRRNSSVLVATLGGLALSLCVEILQRHLPRRDPSLIDLVSNTTGALLGGLIVRHWGERAMQKLPAALADELQRPSPAKFGAALAIWLAWPVVLAFYFAGGLSLDTWDPTAHLAVGNEPQGDRQWEGTVAEVHVVSRPLSPEQVAQHFDGTPITDLAGDRLEASYILRGAHDYADVAGRAPDLRWQDDMQVDDDGAIVLATGRWLRTADTPRELNRALREADGFTLLVTAATADPDQGGEPRIVTLSRSSFARNITLTQQETDLVVRIRNGVTGGNGSDPQFLVSDVFSDLGPHRIAITYDRGLVRAFVDDRAHALRMTPALAIVWGCFPRPTWAVRMGHVPTALHEWILYGLIFIPAAVLVAVQSTLVRHKRRPWLFATGIVLPPVLLQVLFALLYDQPLDLAATFGTLALSSAIGVTALVRLKAWRRIVVSERG